VGIVSSATNSLPKSIARIVWLLLSIGIAVFGVVYLVSLL
jgi:hypothetical protein